MIIFFLRQDFKSAIGVNRADKNVISSFCIYPKIVSNIEDKKIMKDNKRAFNIELKGLLYFS